MGTPSRPIGISLHDLTAVNPDFELHREISAVSAPRALCRHTGDGHFAPVKIFSRLTSWASIWPRAAGDMPFLSPCHQPRVPALTGGFADPIQGNPLSSKSACSSSWGGGYRGKGCDGAGSDPDSDEAGCFPLMGLSGGN